MAKVLGESGRYVSQEAVRKLRKIWLTCASAVLTSGILVGLQLGLLLSGRIPLWTSTVDLVIFGAFLLASKFVIRKMNKLERQRMDMRRGAAGEISVAITIGDFPDDFKVVNDLTTPFGNLDHVVVGPTGVFVLDTKNWRGIVTADGHGELLCNGQRIDKPLVRQFVSRVMGMKEKVKTLAPGLDPYFQPLFVFNSAKVDANWGTTGNVHCLRDDQLFDYIVESKLGKKLNQLEVERIAQAFLALAQMDIGFAAHSVYKGDGRAA